MIHLRWIRVRNPDALPAGFPFDLPIVETRDEIPITAPVVFLVDKDGSGKSTLLEAAAPRPGIRIAEPLEGDGQVHGEMGARGQIPGLGNCVRGAAAPRYISGRSVNRVRLTPHL